MALETGETIETLGDIVRLKVSEFMRQGRRLLAAIEWHLEKRRSRRTLPELTDDELRDVGLTRAEATTEASKSWFWS